MASSPIGGPVIRFSIDAAGITSPIPEAMNQVRAQAKKTSQDIADDWKRMAAQLRATTALGLAPENGVVAAREQLVQNLRTEVSLLQQRGQLTNKQLTDIKAMTLELERQTSFLKGTGGITTGTANALSQVSVQTTLGIERVLDSMVNRYFGGAAGAAFRTVRDATYYSSIANGGQGAGGIFSALASPLGLAGLGIGVAGVGGAAVLTSLASEGGKLAVELDNLARKTGLTTEEVVKLRSASDALDVDFDRVQTAFRKFSQETTLALTGNLDGASKQAKEAAALFNALGIDVKKAAADPYTAVEQLAKSLGELPDGAVKSAVAVQLFGRGGLELIPVLDKLGDATE